MITTPASLFCLGQSALFRFVPILAQVEEAGEEARGYSLEVGLIMLCVILGLTLTLRPSKRAAEFKKRKTS